MNRKTPIRYIIRLAVSAGFILFLVRFSDTGTLLENLGNIDGAIYLSMFLPLAGIYIFSTLRWKYITDSLGYEITFRDSMKIVAQSYGFNRFLPLNMGDMARSKITERYTEVEHGEIIGGVIVERLSDLSVLVLLALLSSLFLASPYLQSVYLVMILGAVIVFAVSTPFLTPELFERLVLRFTSLPVLERFEKFGKDVLGVYSRLERREMAALLSYSIIRWLLGISILYIAAVSLDLHISAALAAFTNSVMGLVAALPISPGGVGPVEAVGSLLVSLSEASYSDGLSIVLVSRSVGFLSMGVIGYIVYLLEELDQ